MDFTKDHKNKVNSLLMEKWGYGKKDEAIEEAEELEEMQGHPGKCCDMAHPDEAHEDYMGRVTIRLAEELPDVSAASGKGEPSDVSAATDKPVTAQQAKKAGIERSKQLGTGGIQKGEVAQYNELTKKFHAAMKLVNTEQGAINTRMEKLLAVLDAVIEKKSG